MSTDPPTVSPAQLCRSSIKGRHAWTEGLLRFSAGARSLQDLHSVDSTNTTALTYPSTPRLADPPLHQWSFTRDPILRTLGRNVRIRIALCTSAARPLAASSRRVVDWCLAHVVSSCLGSAWLAFLDRSAAGFLFVQIKSLSPKVCYVIPSLYLRHVVLHLFFFSPEL